MVVALLQETIPVAPQSVGAWVALIASILALATSVFGGGYAWGKFTSTLNRFTEKYEDQRKADDKRLSKMDERQAAIEETQAQTLDRMRDLHHAQELLMGKFGEASKAAANCDDQTRDMGITIGSSVAELGKKLEALSVDMAGRMSRVETIIDERIPRKS